MKFNFNFFKRKQNKVSRDCACGCSSEARNSVRLTDAEIAEDILCGLEDICNKYERLYNEGADCREKLESCKKSYNAINSYINNLN